MSVRPHSAPSGGNGAKTVSRGSLAALTVRRARPGDAVAIRALLEQLGYTPDPRLANETITQVVRHPEAAVFVAVEGLQVVGFLAMSHRPQIRLGGLLASIDELVVSSQRRAQGIGSTLLETALAHARSLHCRRVELHTNKARESYKRQFYVQRGFKEVGSALLRIDL